MDKQYDKENNIVYHPGVTLAVGENFGEVSSWYGFWAMRKKGDEWHKVSLEGMPIHIPKTIYGRNLVGLKALLMKNGLL